MGGLFNLFFWLGCEAPGILHWSVVFCTGCHSGLSGCYLNVLCRSVCCGELTDPPGLSGYASSKTSASERSRSCQNSFSRLSGRIQAHVRVLCLQRASERAREEKRRRRRSLRSVFRQNDRRCFRIQNMCCCL